MTRINVTKTFLPPIEEYEQYIKEIWDVNQLTNQGPLLKRFEKDISQFLNVKNFQFVSNGTVALQLALKALDITEGEIITTPFSYVATTSSILWERCTPVFVDIKSDDYCINPELIEQAITEDTKAIMAVHVFGNPCDVEAIELIANKHNLKVIYDGAHAFGVTYKGKSLLSYGDVSTCSFHSTKLFHTIEGGGVFTNDDKVNEKIELIKRFGHNGDDHYMLGINAKANEFQAAMGLSNLKYIDSLIESRRDAFTLYTELLSNAIKKPQENNDTQRNYIYYPVEFEDEATALKVIDKLQSNDIYPRRYFYPSLNTLPYIKNKQSSPVSELVASRILCLPLYSYMDESDIRLISRLVNECLA